LEGINELFKGITTEKGVRARASPKESQEEKGSSRNDQ